MTTTPPTFARQDKLKFFRTLNSRVNNYQGKQYQKNRNWKLHLKTIILITLFLHLLLISPLICLSVHLLLTIVMGIGMAGVGMNVMHDGNHGS
jgi:linoleoyl-CoA desaturase